LKVLKSQFLNSDFGTIYDVNVSVRFFFNKDGSYDGLEFAVQGCNDKEIELLRELTLRLANQRKE